MGAGGAALVPGWCRALPVFFALDGVAFYLCVSPGLGCAPFGCLCLGICFVLDGILWSGYGSHQPFLGVGSFLFPCGFGGHGGFPALPLSSLISTSCSGLVSCMTSRRCPSQAPQLGGCLSVGGAAGLVAPLVLGFWSRPLCWGALVLGLRSLALLLQGDRLSSCPGSLSPLGVYSCSVICCARRLWRAFGHAGFV